MISQSEMLTGFLTGTKRWNGAVTHRSIATEAENQLLYTLGVEAERLSRGFFGILGRPDKNG